MPETQPRLRAARPALVALAAALLLAIVAALLIPRPPGPIPPDGGLGRKKAPDQAEELERMFKVAQEDLRLQQYKLAGELLPLRGESPGGASTYALIPSSAAAAVSVEFEVKPVEVPFDEAALRARAFDSEGRALISHPLAAGAYRWRARLRSGGTAAGWRLFEEKAPVHFVVVAPPVRKPDPEMDKSEGPGSSSALSSGDGEGRRRPNPSQLMQLPPIWSGLMPIVAAVLVAAAAAGVLLWRRQRAGKVKK